MYKKIAIITVTLLLLASGCLSENAKEETSNESEAENGEISSVSDNSLSVSQSENESTEAVETQPVVQEKIIVVPPHTETEIVYQDQKNGNYLLLNTTEHTYFVNQTEDDFGGTYTETSETYNLNTDFGMTNVCVKGDNYITFDAKDGGKGVWMRV